MIVNFPFVSSFGDVKQALSTIKQAFMAVVFRDEAQPYLMIRDSVDGTTFKVTVASGAITLTQVGTAG
jgi:hypothetical protein